MKSLTFLLILFFIQGFLSFSNAITKDVLKFPSVNFTTKDGLPSNETFCILQDSKGYIWIGTDRGLVRYDGYEFKIYTTLDGLADNVILALSEDDRGNIWYTTLNNCKLGYIDPSMSFHGHPFQNEIDSFYTNLNYEGLHFNEIYLYQDNIYIVHNTFGYIKINNKGIECIDVEINSDLVSTQLHQVKIETNHFIFAYWPGNILTNTPIDIFDDEGKYVFTYLKKKYKNIYPTNFEQNSRKFIYEGEDLIVQDTLVSHLKLPYQCSAFKLNNKEFLYSTYDEFGEKGIVYYSNSPWVNDNKVELLKGVRVSRAIQDMNGGIWVLTLRKGIFYFPNLKTKLTSSREPIDAILPHYGDILYKNKNSLYKYNTAVGYSKDFNEILDIRNMDMPVSKLSFFGRIFLKHPFRDQYHWNDKILGGRHFRGMQGVSDSLQYIWTRGYLYKFKNKKLSCANLWDRKHKRPPYQQSMYCFQEDSCLFGTRDGFWLYLGDKLVDTENENGKSIRHIEFFNKSKILVYSIWGEGLTLKFNSGKRIRLSEKDGLASNTINSIYMDTNQNLWVGTNRGVNKLSIDVNNKIRLESVIKGSKSLSSPNILQIFEQDSILYLGTDAGFNIVDLKNNRIDIDSDIPIHIESIEINNAIYKDHLDILELSYDSNHIKVNYSALAYNMYGKVNYRYRLLGLSKDWHYTKERKATFLQTNPGKYTFELEAQNELGEWISLKKSLKFIINKPFWETWWFIGGCSALFLLLTSGISYYYISNLKKEKRLIEDKQLLSEELNESRQKALNSQLNPHFVFNSLNSIQNFILTKRTELSSDYLSMFSKLMRFVFENSKQLYVPLSDEIKALHLYLGLEQVRHHDKFDYFIDVDNDINSETLYIPSLLIQPIIENAIWHGLLPKKEGKGEVMISFSSNFNKINVQIEDNGVGRGYAFKKEKMKVIKKQKSSGIELTEKRLSLLYDSTGLDTSIEFIDLFDSNGAPSGTRVIITLPNNLKNQME